MHVIVVGAGNVGYTIARMLSKQHSVLVIEDDLKRYDYVVNHLNVGALNGNGASPKVLKGVINEDTNLLLAVTERDETNIFCCMMAKQINPKLVTVARVRNPDYIEGTMYSKFLNVDHIISPEYLTAVKLMRIAMFENAVGCESIPSLGVELAMFRVSGKREGVTMIPLRELPLPEECKVLVIHRGKQVIVPTPNDVLMKGDKVTIIGKGEAVSEFNRMLGTVRDPRDIVIVGGGIVGEHLATLMEKEGLSVKLIENDEDRCRVLAKKLSRTVIINDNGSDPSVLRNENVAMADVLICATETEEDNLLASLIGKHLGVSKVIATYSKREYEEIFGMSGIDASVGYYHVVANEIIKETVHNYEVMLLLEKFSEEFFDLRVNAGSRVIGKKLGEIDMPKMSSMALVVKDGKAIIPSSETVIEEGDKVFIYAQQTAIAKLEWMFKTNIPTGP
ncbi:MAG: Trk system potassium transporter TrkA [Methanomassiliicoccales archaeon]|jgi:trk system potassium uptake protein TrkA|nr:Trk system potassium transporter TrkA [Methanomassiliicoccales archaeon]MCE5261501.1 Trk system potassium transporter TrkA [Euryarchaeota archaeon]HPD08541.1 Trk system potassium transporter TrkA [Methanomassiliicoccales archaeon]HRR66367.1 Trk system potassium transporter TrkA [Methanomassiliicoccales archaeon]